MKTAHLKLTNSVRSEANIIPKEMERLWRSSLQIASMLTTIWILCRIISAAHVWIFV